MDEQGNKKTQSETKSTSALHCTVSLDYGVNIAGGGVSIFKLCR